MGFKGIIYTEPPAMTTETPTAGDTYDECPWKTISTGAEYADDIDNEFPDIYISDPS